MKKTKDPLKAFKPENPPDFSNLDPFEGRKGADMTMADRVRARIIAVLNQDLGKDLEKRMGTKSAAERQPLVNASAGDRPTNKPPKSSFRFGDREYSLNMLRYMAGQGPIIKMEDKLRKQRRDATRAPELLGQLSASSARIDKDDGDNRAQQQRDSITKSSAEGKSLDTAAQRASLFRIAALRRAVNAGKKLPARQLAERNESVKTAALQTYFLAGLLKTGGIEIAQFMQRPETAAAFLNGLLSKLAALPMMNPFVGADLAKTVRTLQQKSTPRPQRKPLTPAPEKPQPVSVRTPAVASA